MIDLVTRFGGELNMTSSCLPHYVPAFQLWPRRLSLVLLPFAVLRRLCDAATVPDREKKEMRNSSKIIFFYPMYFLTCFSLFLSIIFCFWSTLKKYDSHLDYVVSASEGSTPQRSPAKKDNVPDEE